MDQLVSATPRIIDHTDQLTSATPHIINITSPSQKALKNHWTIDHPPSHPVGRLTSMDMPHKISTPQG
uniref:Uncharacterized protein n=1 Tax=Romanomermis culicivorax TaxID=13658 RepID=A0A915KPK0_ROMCU